MDKFLTELDIIQYWEQNKIFEKSLKKNQLKKFTFYDGPPFATGLPHYGHIVASTIKDIIPRYMTQNGFYVERRFGWDTHGLPIEFEIEKKLGIKTKDDVLKYGIGNYNEECRSIVLKFREEWKDTIRRLGRWVDFDNDYKTMDKSFMESVWWVFSELYSKKLIYRGVKVMPYSNGCTTPLSNFEATSNYKTVSDPSVVIKFKTDGGKFANNVLLVWTTTPWTLPSNLAICVNPKLKYYCLLSHRDDCSYIIAKDCLTNYFKKKEEYTVKYELDGIELVGQTYNPLFNYFEGRYPNSFEIVSDSYVEASSGTGLVHIAPAFGKDDYRVCLEKNIISKDVSPPCPLNENGYFTDVVSDFKNMYIKDADKDIISYLKNNDNIFTSRKENHEYPFCWRSNTPLIYKTTPSWFVNVESIRDNMCKNNSETMWVPSNIRDNKFGKWLENSIDWCISRNRYWGTPIPIWTNEDYSEIICISSAKQLEELAGLESGTITDLHRHHIDNIVINGKTGPLKRIPEVFDCWFESGSMPYAQSGYPYQTTDIDSIFPADFIAEGTDQTRGWFYTLTVLSTALFNKPAFKNVIVNGLVLAKDGEKMSKSKKNYPPVNDVFEKFGADAVRLYLISGPVVKAGDLKFKEADIKTIVKNVHCLMFNMTTYLLQMIDLYQKNTDQCFIPADVINEKHLVTNPIDIWILQYTNKFIEDIHRDMRNYELYHVVSRTCDLIDKLSRWYLKLSKLRFTDCDQIALSVYYECMLNIVVTLAPFTPFMSEIIYQKLKLIKLNEESVHLIMMKESIWDSDTSLLLPMEYLYKVINATRDIRTSKLGKSLKFPVNNLILVHKNNEILENIKILEDCLVNEVNVMNIDYHSNEEDYLEYKLSINPKLGKTLKRKMKQYNDVLSKYSENQISDVLLNTREIDFGEDVVKFSDLVITKKIREGAEFTKEFEYQLEEDIMVLMDRTITPEMEYKYYCKLVIRFLQDFRKECNLVPSDKVIIKYEIIDNNNFEELHELFSKFNLYVEPQIKNTISLKTQKGNGDRIKDYQFMKSVIRFHYYL